VGLMQLLPGTARDMGLKPGEEYDARRNIEGGLKYMAQLKKKYSGDLTKATAAYNFGPGNYDKFLSGKKELPTETAKYMTTVGGAYERGKGGSGTSLASVVPIRGTPVSAPKALPMAPQPTTTAEAPKPFTGKTEGDLALIEEVRLTNSLLTRQVALLQRGGTGASGRAPVFSKEGEAVQSGGLG